MDHGRFHLRVGSRKKVALRLFFTGLLLVTVLVSPSFAQTRVVSLPSQFDRFLQVEFTNVAGIVMSGQTLSLDFVFEDTPFLESVAPVWAQVILQSGPHSPSNPNGDYPYSQYVVFGNGTRAYVLNENRRLLQASMSDWNGGLTEGSAPTLASLETDHGFAGADMLAYPSYGERVGGIHYDIVLPNTGETLYRGRIGLTLETAYPRQAIQASIEPDPVEIEIIPPSAPPVITQQTPPPGEPGEPGEPGVIAFNIADFGAQTFNVPDAQTFVSGYVRVQPGGGAESPAGMVLLGYRNSGVLVSEAVVPDSRPVTAARIYAEVSSNGPVNTGIMVANPNYDAATVNFEIRDDHGDIFRMGNFTLTAATSACDPGMSCNNQLARSLHEAPYFVGPNFKGTLTLTSTAPVAVFAMQWSGTGGIPGDVLMTPLPVIDLSISPSFAMQVVPLFVAGDYRKTELLMVNPTGTPLVGAVQFLDPSGNPAYVGVGGASDWTLEYFVAPNSSKKLTFSGSPQGMAYGSIRVLPYGDTPAPVPFVIQTYQEGGAGVFNVGVPSIMGTAFRMHAEHLPADTRTLLTIANAANHGGTVWLSLTAPDGSYMASTSFYLPPAGEILESLEVLLPSIPNQPTQGVLRLTTDLPGISVAGLRLRYNERQQPIYTSLVPVRENELYGSRERFLAYLANGGGFTTRVVLFSGHPGHSSGTLRFVASDGAPLGLGVYVSGQ